MNTFTKDFLERSGEYSHLVIALLSFLFGLLVAVIADVLRRSREKARLIGLFAEDIRRNWKEVDSLQSAPVGEYWSRMRSTLKDVDNLSFQGEPEYEFEVCNVKLYETEGFKLSQHLSPKARKKFWAAYNLIRDAEAVRKVIKEISSDDKDKTQYQKLFVVLVKNLSVELIRLERLLYYERPWIVIPFLPRY